ncbi:MAG: hypothetical protein IPJ31_00265 [Bacteroidetes bacterium]|nr:hypothetical protein [Bacteroidota bacterium]
MQKLIFTLGIIFYCNFCNGQTTWDITGNANVNGTHFLGTLNQKDLIFKTNGSERMRLSNVGSSLGIGTTTSVGTNLALKISWSDWIQFQRNAGSGYWAFHNGQFEDRFTLFYRDDNNVNHYDYFTVLNDGKIQIGNVSSLPGGYKLYVKDGILTEKVKIALSGTANWADYVFAENYNLPLLSSVEDFIIENKHLPGVPSAADLVETGINVAEMDATLMKKIEELTLYVIQLSKENEIMKKEIDKLKMK